MKRFSIPTYCVTLVMALAGCSANAGPAAGPLPPGSAEARVQVTNNNWLDMTVYAERSGGRVRLGTVTSMETETLSLPRSWLDKAASVRFIASALGSSSAFAAGPVDVSPGRTVRFNIENQVGISNISVW